LEWFTLTGLILDVVGFTLITLDVLPDFDLRRNTERLESILHDLDGVPDQFFSETDESSIARYGSEAGIDWNEQDERARKMGFKNHGDLAVTYHVWDRALSLVQEANALSKLHDAKAIVELKSKQNHFDKQAVVALFQSTLTKLYEDRTNLRSGYSTFGDVRWGFYLVTAGFGLQIIGVFFD
jgi:hypothetical protein